MTTDIGGSAHQTSWQVGTSQSIGTSTQTTEVPQRECNLNDIIP
jgi:hypothetical protein